MQDSFSLMSRRSWNIWEKLTEADDWRQACQAGIADALRDCEASNGDSCDEISFEEVEGIARSPFEYGDEVLQGEYELF